MVDSKPHFFKVIVSSIQHKQLRIPPRFSRKYVKELSSTARLAVTTGAVWEVELVMKSDHEVWLRRGWDRFMTDLSINLGHFLVFQYQGNSHFKVIIFDMSATEIEYQRLSTKTEPRSHCNVKEEEKVDSHDSDSDDEASMETIDDSDDDDVSLEILEDSTSRTTSTSEIEIDDEDTKDETSVEILDDSVSSSRKRKEPDEDTEDETSVEILDFSASSLRKRKEPPSTSFACPVRASRDRNRMYVKEAILRKAKKFRCKNASFMVVMCPSYVSDKYSLHIPRGHSWKYLPKKENKIITLQTVRADKTWRTKYSVGEEASCVKMSSGWDVFVRENDLKLGDVCVFERVGGPDNLYVVHIFRD
ncbi:hypothetical protein Droror1_Dr00019459 [Drosera rotundifolia]